MPLTLAYDCGRNSLRLYKSKRANPLMSLMYVYAVANETECYANQHFPEFLLIWSGVLIVPTMWGRVFEVITSRIYKQMIFRWKSPLSSGLKRELSMKPAETAQPSNCFWMSLAWLTIQSSKLRQYVDLQHHTVWKLHGHKSHHVTKYALTTF
jgi:hypothetical protein